MYGSSGSGSGSEVNSGRAVLSKTVIIRESFLAILDLQADYEAERMPSRCRFRKERTTRWKVRVTYLEERVRVVGVCDGFSKCAGNTVNTDVRSQRIKVHVLVVVQQRESRDGIIQPSWEWALFLRSPPC